MTEEKELSLHIPFDKDNEFSLLASWTFWIINLIQVAVCPLIVLFFEEFGLPVSEAMRQLVAINLGMGAVVIVFRLTWYAIEDIRRTPKKSVVENGEKHCE